VTDPQRSTQPTRLPGVPAPKQLLRGRLVKERPVPDYRALAAFMGWFISRDSTFAAALAQISQERRP